MTNEEAADWLAQLYREEEWGRPKSFAKSCILDAISHACSMLRGQGPPARIKRESGKLTFRIDGQEVTEAQWRVNAKLDPDIAEALKEQTNE